MRDLVRAALTALILTGCASRGHPPAPNPAPSSGWVLTWADEFDGAAGTAPDPSRWSFDVGGDGWGNNELEYYTAGAANAAVDGAGHLVIEARRERVGGRGFTSARILTKGHFTQVYGRFEAKLRVPTGSGIWPAFWMLGDDIDTVGWPASGEIDVMELIGRQPSTLYGTAHAGDRRGHWQSGASIVLPAGTFADADHVFAVEWTPDSLRWYLDGMLYHTFTRAQLAAGQRWPFDHPFFIILNVAVGGDWPGPPAPDAVFPQRMIVDYVRVYKTSKP